MSPETTIDERFDELVAALRTELPPSPEGLRERVASITAAPPEPRRFTPRRILAYAAPAAAGLSLAVALAVGLSSAFESQPGRESAVGTAQRDRAVQPGTGTFESLPAEGADQAGAPRLTPPGPVPGRAQDFSATLTLLVEETRDLSRATQRALNTTRRLGGYVVSVDYATPEPGEGSAAVRVRIPISRVQAAIVQFNGLGELLAQETRIADLQQPLDELTRRIRRLERRAAQATGVERARLLAQIEALRRQRIEINRRAAYASVSLDLTTREPAEPQPAPGRLDRALGDAVGILVAELVIAAYALIVASPLLVLLAAAFFGNRAYRRYADQRLLERA